MLSASSFPDTYDPRPPTPPKDTNKDISEHVQSNVDFLANGYDETDQDAAMVKKAAPSTDTPPASSPTSLSHERRTGLATSKKVGFSPAIAYHEVPHLCISSSPRDRLKISQPRLKPAKPPKSILKRGTNSPLPTPDEADPLASYFGDTSSVSKMLPSVLQALASEVRSSRLDAYMTLIGAFKNCEDMPDRQSIASKMGLFQQHISRDMVAKDSEGKLDTQVATQAMSLLILILSDDALAKALDDNFRAFLVEESITVLKQSNMPKALFKAHLFLLAHQQFNHSVMTDNRTDRILALLRSVEDRCTGNSPAAGRIVIYQRLLEQNPAIMNAKAPLWLEHVFHGMLSSSKELRGRSIEACTYAGILLGTNPATCKALQQLFDTVIEEEQDYFDYLRSQLISLVRDESFNTYVPRVWSAVILFFRSRQKSFESWPRLKPWLEVLQPCLNASDTTVKYHAHLAWHRFVFAVMPDASTSRQMRSMLKIPIVTALAKPAKEKSNKYARQMAMDNYNNLLHYALRPSSTFADLDIAWDEFAEPVLLEMVTAGAGGRRFACKVLHGLLTTGAGAWNEKAALEAEPIKPEDLPRLDARWVRSRMAKILKVVDSLLNGLLRSPDNCAVAIKTWQEVLQAVADAGAQEVRTSNELREAIALIMNLFRRLWRPCSSLESQPQTLDSRMDTFRKLLQKTCQYVGPALLAEDILARTPQGDAQAAPTPSHRASKHQYALQSPLVFIAVMICHSETPDDESSWHAVVSDVLELACEAKTTSASKVHLIARTLQTVYAACSEERARQRAQSLWPIFASLTSDGLMLSHVETSVNGALGQQMRDAVDVLSRGLLPGDATAEHDEIALGLFTEMVRITRSQAGDAGVVLAVCEPLAKSLVEREHAACSVAFLRCASAMLHSAPWPQSRHAMDQARRVLWGTTVGSYKPGAFDPYEQLYRLICQASEYAYQLCASESRVQEHALTYLDALNTFLSACPDFAATNALRHSQPGVMTWLDDVDRLVVDSGQPIRGKVAALWTTCRNLLGSALRKESNLLMTLHPLLVAAFLSPDRAIVNDTILLWNEIFSEKDALLYPSKLEQVLRALQPHVELSLPGFPTGAVHNGDIVLPAFEQTQQDATASFSSRWSGLPRGTVSPVKLVALKSVDRSSQLQTLGTTTSAKTDRTTSTRPTPKARLRHDDSQVQFAPIESSPLRRELGSQLLTGRQKEVRERQEQDAQMFPDLSSSPAKPKQTTRRLDFAPHLSRPGEDEAVSTPLELPEGHGDMSDYLGSSPTPHSSDRTAIRDDVVDVIEDEEQPEPPSSPPQSPQAKSSFVANSAEHGWDSNDNYMTAQQSNDVKNDRDAYRAVPPDSDSPPDSVLPAEQLQHETEGAVDPSQVELHGDSSKVDVDATTVVDATDLQDTAVASNAPALLPATSAKRDTDEADDVDVSRIENSFPDMEPGDNAIEASEVASQETTRGTTRKRKRGGSGATASKMRKTQTPLERLVSGISGYFSVNQNGDNDTEDEIVVASSQPTNSPASRRHAELDVELEPKASSQPTTTVKRGRGRPRKSETPTPAVPATAATSTKKLKRKASALSDATALDLDLTTVKETPAPAKARKQRKSKNGKAVDEPADEDAGDVRPPSRRVATEVAIEPSDTPSSLSRTRMPDSDDDDNTATPQKQLEDEAAASGQERPIATPRGILGRLKDILADYKKSILGPGEEREHDDVLFALRTEMHEAGRRGRQA